jgi:hypothetical protein
VNRQPAVKDKYIDHGYATVDLTTTRNVHYPMDIENGSAFYNRLTQTCFCDRIEFKLTFAASATDGNNLVRCMLVRGFLGTSVMTDLPDSFSVGIDPYRFQVLKDTVITLASTGDGYGSGQGPGVFKKYVSWNINVKKLVSFYGADGDMCIQNHFIFVMFSDSGVTPYPTVDGFVRTYFHDVF